MGEEENFAIQTIDDKILHEIIHPLQRPYHIRLEEYEKARARIFKGNNGKRRSSNRIRQHYARLRSLRSCRISPIISQELDSRPFVYLKIRGDNYLALLDSGANRSIIGGNLGSKIQNFSGFQRCVGNVRTADGQKQNVLGTVRVEVEFQGQYRLFVFLLVPS